MTAWPGVRAALDAHLFDCPSGELVGTCRPDDCWFEGTAKQHRAHLADALAPLLDEAAADGWDEGWDNGAKWVQSKWPGTNKGANPHRARREDAPPSPDAECCASGRCEVCSPGYVWGRDQ